MSIPWCFQLLCVQLLNREPATPQMQQSLVPMTIRKLAGVTWQAVYNNKDVLLEEEHWSTASTTVTFIDAADNIMMVFCS